jgi:hypothetical protein
MVWIFFPVLSVSAQDLVNQAQALQHDLQKSELKASGAIQSQFNLYSPNSASGAGFRSIQQGQLVLNYANRLNIPFQFYFANAQFSSHYQLPVLRPQQQMGTTFTYKAFTFLAGYRSLLFSSYSLQGVPFQGGGCSFQSPKQKMKFTLAGGNFLVATAPQTPLPFKRYGLLLQSRFGDEKNHLALVLCKWKDFLSAPTNTFNLLPGENLVLGSSAAFCYKKWCLKGDYNQSIYTHNLLQGIQRRNGFTYFNEYVDPRPSTRIYNHVLVQANQQDRQSSHHLEVQRTDDGYTSMGAPWVLNDVLRANYQWQYTPVNKEQSLQTECTYLKNNLRHLQSATLHQASSLQTIHLRFLQKWSVEVQQHTFFNVLQKTHHWQSTTRAQLSYARATAKAILHLHWQEHVQTGNGQLLLQHQCSFSSHYKKRQWQWHGNYQLIQIVLLQQHRFSHQAAFSFAHSSRHQKLKWQSSLATRLQSRQPFFTETLHLQYQVTEKQMAALQTVLQKQWQTNALTYQLTLSYRWQFTFKTANP